MNRTIGVACIFGMASFIVAESPALAQDTDQAVRLGVDGVFFSGEFATYKASGSAELDTALTNAGLYAGSFGLGLGYAFSKNGVIGARLIHGSSKYEVDGAADSATTRFTLLPYAEYVVTASPTVQPFFAGSAGFQIGSSDTAGGAESTSSAFMFGLSAGLHLFATETFSIDPHFSYYRANGSARVFDVDVDYGANVFLLGFSLSGWIGGLSSGRGDPVDETQAAVSETESLSTGGSMPAPSPPAPPEVQLKVSEEGELLSGALGLGVGQLTLLGRPTADAENIAVRVTVRGNELEQCRAGTLIADDQRFELRNVIGRAREHGSMTVVVLQGTVSSQELSAFADAEIARIALCGRVISLSADQREAIARYFEEFRHRAVEANTWGAKLDSNGSAKTAPTSNGSDPSAPKSPPPKAAGSAPAPAKQAPKTQSVPAPTPITPPPNGGAPPTGSFENP